MVEKTIRVMPVPRGLFRQLLGLNAFILGMLLILMGLTSTTPRKPNDPPPWVWLLFDLPIVAITVHGWKLTRLHGGKEAVLGPEGVGAGLDGEDLWTLPWSQFGGYRTLKFGIEVVDRKGVVIGQLPVSPRFPNQKGRIRYRTRAFFRELDAQVPEGGPKYEPPASPSRPPSRSRGWLQIAFGSLLSAAAVVVMTIYVRLGFSGQPLEGAAAQFVLGKWLLLGMLALFVGPILLIIGIGELRRFRPKIVPREPEEGPTLGRFQEDREGVLRKVDLEPGQRYRIVDPDRQRLRIESELRAVGILSVAFPVLLAVGWGLGHLNPDMPHRDETSANLLLLSLGALFCAFPAVNYWALRKRLDALGDVVIREEGLTVIVKPSGEHLTFTDRARSFRMERADYLFEDGRAYALDRTHLFDAGSSKEPRELWDCGDSSPL